MIYGTTNSPILVAGIEQINAVSAREESYKTRIAELESALSESRKRADFYQRMWEIQADETEALKSELRARESEIMSYELMDAERRARRREAIRTRQYEQPRRAGGWMI